MWKKVLLIILIVLLAAILAVGLWQKDRIMTVKQYLDRMNISYLDAIKEAPALWKAYQYSNNYTTDEIAEQLAAKQEVVNQALKNYQVDISRDFTLEEETKLLTGALTPKEALDKISSENQSENQSSVNSQSDNQTQSQDNEQAIVNKYVSQLYSCKANYLGQLGQAIAAKDVGQAVDLEGECDSQVAGILASMESELQAIGASTDIVTTIRNEYEEEKTLTKSYYIEQYKQYSQDLP